MEWQRGKSPDNKSHTDAIDYCKTLSLSGTGWRMPTVRELYGLVDIKKLTPPIDTTFFPQTPVANWWTGTNWPDGNPNDAMAVGFWIGRILVGGTQFGNPVRCVRGDGT